MCVFRWQLIPSCWRNRRDWICVSICLCVPSPFCLCRLLTQSNSSANSSGQRERERERECVCVCGCVCVCVCVHEWVRESSRVQISVFYCSLMCSHSHFPPGSSLVTTRRVTSCWWCSVTVGIWTRTSSSVPSTVCRTCDWRTPPSTTWSSSSSCRVWLGLASRDSWFVDWNSSDN